MTRSFVVRPAVVVFAMLAALLALAVAAAWERSDAVGATRDWSRHTYDVLAAIKDLDVAARDAESGQRGFLLTGEDGYLAPYDAALSRMASLQAELRRLTADNPAEQDRLRALAPILQDKLDELAQTIELRRTSGPDPALAIVRKGAGRGYMERIEAILSAMADEERELLADRQRIADEHALTLRSLVLAGTLAATLALLWAAFSLNRSVARAESAEEEQRSLALLLRATLESLSQGVAVFDDARRLSHWNGCFGALLDLPKAVLWVGAPYAAMTDRLGEGRSGPLETEGQIRQGGDGLVTYERLNAEGHQLEIRRSPMPDGGFVLTISDMTKRAQAEAVLRESQKMQAIGQLTGGIAHDFNNLLTVILGNLEIVGTRIEQSTPLRKRIERAAWAAQRGATLTAQLLAFARKQPLAPTAIDLAATMPDLVPLLTRTLGETVMVRYVEGAGLWPAMADPAQVESAVLNLALNARDAMPDGGRLTIELANRTLDRDYARTHTEVSPGDYAMLAVSDTGRGMPPEVAARAFEPFFTTKTDGKGSGLGLAMVFGFVKQSGGHVKVYSEPGQGTSVRLYLPRAVGAMAARTPVSGGTVPAARANVTVLVVEDEAAVREIAVEILQDLGYRVLQAADAKEGQRVFAANVDDVDLLLTDVVLPGRVRGRELADGIKAAKPSIRVVFMSGYTENSIVHHGRLDDGVLFIAKPFRRDQLARKVAEALEPARGDPTANDKDADPPPRSAA